jgi:hypothetical protein
MRGFLFITAKEVFFRSLGLEGHIKSLRVLIQRVVSNRVPWQTFSENLSKTVYKDASKRMKSRVAKEWPPRIGSRWASKGPKWSRNFIQGSLETPRRTVLKRIYAELHYIVVELIVKSPFSLTRKIALSS